jgi:glycosyltransferase involved in cell wall biosynthesis
MRIGVFLEGSPEAGGGFQLQMAILDGLRGIGGGDDPELVVFVPDGLLGAVESVPEAFRMVRVPRPGLAQRAGRRVLRSYRDVPAAFRGRIQTQAQELIHSHGIDLVYYPGPNMQCLDHDTPFVLTVYDLQHRLQPEFPEVSAGGKWMSRERFYAEAIPRAFTTVVATSALKEDIVRIYRVRDERIRVLPYIPGPAVHTVPSQEPSPQVKHGIPPDFLFYPARFWPHKNHAGLLHALRLLREREGARLSLVLVGSDKRNQPYIRRLAKDLDLADQVFFLGFVSDVEMAALYRMALAMVMPSFFGPTNLPPLEAFALRCPVVTSDIPGAREQFGDAAIFVNPRDPADIARGILEVWRDTSLRGEMTRRGLEIVRRWTAKDYAAALMEIFSSFDSIRRCWE